MTTGHMVRIAIVVLIVLLLLGRRRGRAASSQAPVLAAPGGPQQLGSFRTLPIRTPVSPVSVPEVSRTGVESGLPVSNVFPPSSPDWNHKAAADWNSGRPVSLSPAEAEELSKLDSLRASGTLTEAAYLEARARLFGTSGPVGWSVTLLSAGANKLTAIKALRECRRDLDLSAAKNLVEHTPNVLFRSLARADAEQVTTYLQQSGVPAQLGPDA